MTGARVVVSQVVFPECLAPLEEAGFEVHAERGDAPLPPEELRAVCAEADALICMLTDRVDADLLRAAPHVKVVANVAVGYDNIDVAAAGDAGVAVTNTPGVLTEATADLAFALLLSVARRVPEGDAFLRAGRYTHWKLDQEQMGLDVQGRTLGIVGLGQIGRAVARRAARDWLDENIDLIPDDVDLSGASIRVGSKEFTEQLILGQLTKFVLEEAGANVSDQTGLVGSVTVRQALTSGEIDMYWEYLGTGWVTYLDNTEAIPDPQEQYEALKEADAANGIVWLEPAPFNNTYAIAMTNERSEELGITRISQIAELLQS